jgi:mRNA-degrading endonuclease YafQ of YafQ-DinJ toxin-antitoxin module
MYSIEYTNEFKKQAKLMQKRSYNMELLNEAIKYLLLPEHCRLANIKRIN